MSLIVPDAVEVIVLNFLLTNALTLRLYGNDVTPVGTTTVSAFTEIVGGGYANKPLTFANWTVTAGDPSVAVYSATQVWTFTDVINSPGSVYGYYVTRNSDNQLMWAERFPAILVPFAPINGSIIKVLPRFLAQSLF